MMWRRRLSRNRHRELSKDKKRAETAPMEEESRELSPFEQMERTTPALPLDVHNNILNTYNSTQHYSFKVVFVL